MAFGQAAGPPASARQIDELGALLDRAGFASFREARHPFGLTQRQAGGKFTVAEATELIERLTAAETVQQAGSEPPVVTDAAAEDGVPARPRSEASRVAARRREARPARTLSSLDDAVLVAELERRGWCCIPPITDVADADG